MTDEDEEVVLEGGPFHRYLMENTDIQCSSYKKDSGETAHRRHSLFSIPIKAVSAEAYECINILLKSSLLLDEDAQFLFYLRERSEVHYEHLNLKTLISFAVLVLLAMFMVIFSQMFEIWLALFVISCMISFKTVSSLFTYRNLNKNIRDWCEYTSEAYAKLKKHYSHLRENICIIRSKEMRSQIRSQTIERYKGTKESVLVMTSDLTLLLLTSVNICKETSVDLLESLGDIPTDLGITALLSDNELGFNHILAQLENEELIITNLEKLRHTFILLNSEYMKLIGYYLYKVKSNSKRNKIANIISKYNQYLKTLALKKLNLQVFGIKATSPKRNISKDSAQVCAIADNLKLILNSLTVEISEFNYVLDSDIPIKDSHDIIMESFTLMAEDVEEIRQCLKNLKTTMIKESQDVVPLSKPMIDDKEERIKIEVGRSDFDIHTSDEVFIGISNEQDDSGAGALPVDDDVKPDTQVVNVYNRVLEEMEGILTDKKQEYDRREQEAIKQLPAELQQVVESMNVDLSSSASGTCKSSTQPIVSSQTIKSKIGSKSANIELQKALALKALERRHQWNLRSGDESNFEG